MLRYNLTKYLAILLIGMLAGLLVAGLHPFNFAPENEVSWLPGENGVRFEGYGEVYGVTPLRLFTGSEAGGKFPAEFTIELVVASREHSETEVSDIVSIWRRGHGEPFAIEQWRNGIVINGPFRDPDGQRVSKHIGVGRILAGEERRLVTVTSGVEGTAIYADGTLEVRNQALMVARESLAGTLLLGQTARGRQEWHGDILGLALYPRMLTATEVKEHVEAWRAGKVEELRAPQPGALIYRFDERRGEVVHNVGAAGNELAIPNKMHALRAAILERPSRDDWTNFSDVTLNLLGFIPFGMLLVFCLKSARQWPNGKSVVVAVLAGFLVSLLIEVLQVLLPSRDSSLLDLINNTLGTAMGAGLGVAAWPRVVRWQRGTSRR